MKRPAFQFYPGDWQRDAALRACSVGARGLWIEMMCVMHQADPYGYLVLNSSPIEPSQLARMVGASVKEVIRWLAELQSAGVQSTDEKGVFSRRMVRDEYLRNVRGSGGVLGGNPSLVEPKVEGKVNHTANHSPTLHPTPSSSVFSLPTSTSNKTKTAPAKRAIPPDFGISDRVKAWALDYGHSRLDERLAHFVGYARANGKTYADWDQGFMNAIRDDWAKLNAPKAPVYSFDHLTDGV